MDNERIPREDMDKAWRNLIRRTASTLVYAMAEADMDFASIAKRSGQKEKDVRKFLLSLIEGTSEDEVLRGASDMARAMDVRLEFRLVPNGMAFELPAGEEPEPEEDDDGD